MLRVLIHEWVTGGGFAGEELPQGWAAEGAAMRRALARDFNAVAGVEVVMTLDERFTPEGHPFRVVPVGAGAEVATLERLAADCDCTLVVAPETGGVLADRLRRVDRAGGRSLGSEASAVELAGDKVRLAAHLESRGVPTIPTRAVRVADGLPADTTFPAVLKPVDGAGAWQTFVLDGFDDLGRHRGTPEVMALQPYVADEPWSATFLVGPAGALRLVAVGKQWVALRDGVISYAGGSLPAPSRFADGPPWDAVRAVPGLRGLVGVDFLRDRESNISTVVEINPRPTTSAVCVVAVLAPGRLARAWLNAAVEGEGVEGCSPMLEGGKGSVALFTPDGKIRVY